MPARGLPGNRVSAERASDCRSWRASIRIQPPRASTGRTNGEVAAAGAPLVEVDHEGTAAYPRTGVAGSRRVGDIRRRLAEGAVRQGAVFSGYGGAEGRPGGKMEHPDQRSVPDHVSLRRRTRV